MNKYIYVAMFLSLSSMLPMYRFLCKNKPPALIPVIKNKEIKPPACAVNKELELLARDEDKPYTCKNEEPSDKTHTEEEIKALMKEINVMITMESKNPFIR